MFGSSFLSSFADFHRLEFITDKEKRDRIEMIDQLWIDQDNNIQFAIEVENSTNFTSGIQRASNLGVSTKKLMIVPDLRSKEFKSIKDPLFVDNFKKYNWFYIFYSNIERIKSLKIIKEEDISAISQGL